MRHAFLNCSAERLKEDFTRQLLRGVYVTRSSRDLRVTFDLVIKELGNGNTVMTKGVFMQFMRLLQPNTEPMSDQDLHWVWSYCDTNTDGNLDFHEVGSAHACGHHCRRYRPPSPLQPSPPP